MLDGYIRSLACFPLLPSQSQVVVIESRRRLNGGTPAKVDKWELVAGLVPLDGGDPIRNDR